jgi:hypothetical protein
MDRYLDHGPIQPDEPRTVLGVSRVRAAHPCSRACAHARAASWRAYDSAASHSDGVVHCRSSRALALTPAPGVSHSRKWQRESQE